jgi:endogenous inhibitor of DNA gyrase (YacG/DUF329 family)
MKAELRAVRRIRYRVFFQRRTPPTMAPTTCPTCSRPFDTEATDAMPFCSRRCRLIDLGRWLDEGIGLPYTPSEEDESWEETAG